VTKRQPSPVQAAPRVTVASAKKEAVSPKASTSRASSSSGSGSGFFGFLSGNKALVPIKEKKTQAPAPAKIAKAPTPAPPKAKAAGGDGGGGGFFGLFSGPKPTAKDNLVQKQAPDAKKDGRKAISGLSSEEKKAAAYKREMEQSAAKARQDKEKQAAVRASQALDARAALKEAVAVREADLRAKNKIALDRKAAMEQARKEARTKADEEKRRVQVSLSLGGVIEMGSYPILYTSGVLFHAERFIRQLWCPSTINVTSLASPITTILISTFKHTYLHLA